MEICDRNDNSSTCAVYISDFSGDQKKKENLEISGESSGHTGGCMRIRRESRKTRWRHFGRPSGRKMGIELDVHLTRDKKLVVFHDDTLQRMCGVSGTVEEKTWEELKTLHLLDTAESIPLLRCAASDQRESSDSDRGQTTDRRYRYLSFSCQGIEIVQRTEFLSSLLTVWCCGGFENMKSRFCGGSCHPIL